LGVSYQLKVEQRGLELHITGLLPRYLLKEHPSDLIKHFEKIVKVAEVGKKRTGTESPDMLFANADTDDKLIAFVQRFGPVVAKRAYTNFEIPEKGLAEPRMPARIIGVQDMHELRNEHRIYRAALALVMQLKEADFDYQRAQTLIREIAVGITEWPRQWEREKSQRKIEPFWKLSAESIKRIDGLKSAQRTELLPPALDARIVVCELLNCFRGTVFPGPLEMHSSIKFGVRPLLYSLLRRQFLGSRDFTACANTQCRNFFNIERTGQKFCCSECSTHQRQRVYWAKSGKKLRKKRIRKQRNLSQ
jgi:hypothetical protein